MSDIRVIKGITGGTIDPIPSKSTIHRSLICALLVRGKSKITNIIFSDDVIATIDILKSCGVTITESRGFLEIDSTHLTKPTEIINVNESGSTLRFIVPVLLYLFGELEIDGKEGLRRRPHDVFKEIFDFCDISYNSTTLPITAKGNIKAGNYSLPGHVSSQFISGLLFVLPLLDNDSQITFTTELESVGYVDLTIDVLRKFGVKIKKVLSGYKIEGSQKYKTNVMYVNEIDESNINFWRIPKACGMEMNFTKENSYSSQPDRQVVEILNSSNKIISVKNIPDSLPILVAYACISGKDFIFTDTYRTKIKECNRLMASKEVAEKFGYFTKLDQNENLFIYGRKKRKKPVKTTSISSYNDHRIVMMIAILAGMTDTEVIIENFQAVNKSYPNFFEHFEKLGGQIQKL